LNHTFPADEIVIDDVSYPLSKPIHVQGTIKKVDDKAFVLEGEMDAEVVIPCSRCTVPVDYPIQAGFSKDLKLQVEDGDSEEAHEYLTGYLMDLEKLVYDELYLNFPMKVVCKEDCKGICPECGANLNETTCDCMTDRIDLRFAGLKELFKDR
jgi:uncharacterized protein